VKRECVVSWRECNCRLSPVDCRMPSPARGELCRNSSSPACRRVFVPIPIGLEKQTRRVADSISALATSVRTVTVSKDYVSNLSAALAETDSIRVSLKKMVDSTSDGGAAASRADVLAVAQAFLRNTRLCASLPRGRGRAVVLRRSATLLRTLKASLLQELGEATAAVRWPDAVMPDAGEQSGAVLSLFGALAQLQRAHESVIQPETSDSAAGSQGEHDGGGGGGVAGGDVEQPRGILWAVDALMAPLRRKFKFHFRSARATNSREHPEWCLSFVLKQLRDREQFLQHSLQSRVDDDWVSAAVVCRVLSCTVVYCRVLSCTVVYCRVLSCTVVYCRVLSCTVVYCRVLSCTVVYCRVLSCRVVGDCARGGE
jgi:hypothetical protein